MEVEVIYLISHTDDLTAQK